MRVAQVLPGGRLLSELRERSPVTWWRLVRWGGLVGAGLLAVAAWLGGARRTVPFHPTPASIWRGPHGPAILLCWLAGTAVLVLAWSVGRRGTPGLRWALVTVGLWLLPLLVSPPLGSRDVYAYACQGAVYRAGHNPYAEGVAALPCPWLESVSPIWRDTPAPYGQLFLMIAGAAVAVGGSLVGTVLALRAVALLGVGLAAVSLPVLARRAGLDPARATWLALACPLVAIHLVSGAHNDALMIGLLLAGLAVIASHTVAGGGSSARGDGRAGVGGRVEVARWGWLVVGGALLGLAVAVKATAGVAVPFAALLAVPRPYTWMGLLRRGGWVIGGAVAALLGVTAVSGLGFGWLGGLSDSGASVQWTAPSTALGMTLNLLPLGFDAVPVTRALGLAALAVVLVVLWWRARPTDAGLPVAGRVRGDACYATGVALAATVVLAPVFHPWYATWPLFVLAATAHRTRWFAVPCLVACFLDLPDGTSLALSTRAQGAVAMTLLTACLLVRAVRRARRPQPTT